MQKTRKILSIMITVIMAMVMLSSVAFAAEEPVQYAFDVDDLNKIIPFPTPIHRVIKGDNPLYSFTAPVAGTYIITVSSPKDILSGEYSLDGNAEVTLQAGEVHYFRARVSDLSHNHYYPTRIKIQEKTCTDADNNNICDVCGSVCSGETDRDNLTTLDEIKLGELVDIGPKNISWENSCYAKFAFTPPASGEYYFSAGDIRIELYSDEALTDLIYSDVVFSDDQGRTKDESIMYPLTGNTTYYILVNLGYNSTDSNSNDLGHRDLRVVTHEFCSDLNHDGFCDADQTRIGDSIIPGEHVETQMGGCPTTAYAVITPEEDGFYRLATSRINLGNDPIDDVDFS